MLSFSTDTGKPVSRLPYSTAQHSEWQRNVSCYPKFVLLLGWLRRPRRNVSLPASLMAAILCYVI